MIYMNIDATTNAITQYAHIRLLDPVPSWVTNTFDDTDADALKAIADPTHYAYANDAWTYVPPSSTELLADAQQAQSTLIDAGYAQTMSAGFTSQADGTLRTYPADQGTISELLMLRSVILANTFPTSGVSVLDAQGNHYTFTQSQCSQLITDAQNFYMGNRNQRLQLLSQIQQATTVSAVQAITWTPASYTPQPAPAA